MEIFENRASKQPKIDDTQKIQIKIETTQQIQNHTEYVLVCQRGYNENTSSWRTLRRYNDFYLLNRCFSSFGICLPFPKKKLLGNMRPEFIAERRKLLQEYINLVLMNPILASSLPAKRFVDPDTYGQSFHDNAVQNASLCLRNEGIYVLSDEHYANIGWRIRKQYFKVIPKITEYLNKPTGIRNFVKPSHRSQSQQSKAYVPTHSTTEEASNYAAIAAASVNCDLVLEWIEYGPDKYIEDREVQGILKSLIGLQHPYIEPIKYATCNENGLLVIRKFYKQGSLKDQICVAPCPKKPYLAKYGNPKERKSLSWEDIAKYGIQILEALKFLQSKGLPFGHLHSGNIVIHEGSVRLLDIENFICGVPSFYRPFFVQHSKLYSLETIDVYCFGHVLYEMFMSHPLQESQARQISNCPDSFKQLLESILSKEACKVGLPTLDNLLQHQFFKEYYYNRSVSSPCGSANPNCYLKLSVNVKSDIQAAKLKYEQRLRDEQKSIKNQKRLSKVQECMSLEEERKSKHRTKTEQRQARLKHQHSLHKNHSFSLNERTHSSLDNSQSVSSVNTETPEHTIPEFLEARTSSSVSEVESAQKEEDVKQTDNSERSALLESISSFNRKSLRRVNHTNH